MLRRDRQIRTQLYQLKDAVLFALALWMAHTIRNNIELPHTGLLPFSHFAWLYLVIIPGAPFILELQGFYKRPLLCPRYVTGWLLFKGCVFVTLGIIVVLFLFGMKDINRLVIIFFGIASFVLVFLSEEILRWGYKSKFGQLQLRKRVMLVGTAEDTARLKAELASTTDEALDVVGEVDINRSSPEELIRLLHERSPNGVILNAR